MTISHKIELIPNNKAKTYFSKAFGCSRLAYNWGLARWKEKYEAGEKVSYLELKKEFNRIKKEQFPFVYEVTKYAVQQPFFHLNEAFQKFFRDLKDGKNSYPKFKKKRDGAGSFYIGGDQTVLTDQPKISKKLDIRSDKKKYLKIPNLGYVKMREELRFRGKINGVTISQRGERYYASFSVEIDKEEYRRTHKPYENTGYGIGIDVGVNSFAVMSNGIKVYAPKPLAEEGRKLVKISRQLSGKQHPKTKGDATKKSANYRKTSRKLSELHRHIVDIRTDFEQKLSTAIVRTFDHIAIEDLNISGMMQNHHLARAVSDVSFYEFRRQLTYKAGYMGKTMILADRFYPSSKICSVCGSRKADLKLSEREYVCPFCGARMDRDYNASVNLFDLIKNKIGRVPPELTPADLTALQELLAINLLATSKVETGIQQKSYL